MRKGNSTFLTGFLSEAGTFRYNHDYFAFVELDDFACWIVADGIKSEDQKKSAEIVAHHLFAEFTENPTISKKLLKKYFENAQRALLLENGAGKLTASLVMVVTDYAHIVWAVAGNARLYHFRKGGFSFKSNDQSIAQLLMEIGKVNSEELDRHEERYNLYNYFGKSEKFEPFISNLYELHDGDVMLLCTAGFWESIALNEIISALKAAESPGNFVDNLEEIILKKQNDALNNYTMGAIYADKVFKEERFYKAPTEGILSNGFIKIAALVAAGLLLLTGAGFFINQQLQQKNQLAQVEQKPSPRKVVQESPLPSPEPSVETVSEDTDEMPVLPVEPTLEVPQVPVVEANNVTEERPKPKPKPEQVKEEKTVASNNNAVNKSELQRYESLADKSFRAGNYEGASTNYRNALNLAKKINDSKKTNLLESKYEVSKLVLSGDNAFNDRSYNAALERYKSASKKASALGLSTNYLSAKQDKTEKCIFVVQLINEGDAAYKKGDLTKAKSCYFHANSLANQYGFAYSKQQLKLRMSKLGAKPVEGDPAKVYSEAKRLEEQGDSKSQQKEYGEAVKLYTNAKNLYQQLNKSDEVANVDSKIKKAEKGMNTLMYKLTHK